MFKILVCVCICSSLAIGQEEKSLDPQAVQVNYTDGTKDSGPTVYLGTDSDEPKENSVEDFMYFVPLIAPVDVQTHTSLNNNQATRIISIKREKEDDRFEAVCEFVMTGSGSFRNDFNPEQIIEKGTEDIKAGKPLKNMIDYINFKGCGKGSVHIEGQIKNGAERVISMTINFNEDDNASPVTVGLYSVPCENGQYKYKSKYSQTIARVNSLTFKNEPVEPRMTLELAAISKPGKKEGFCSRLKGAIANLFVKPLKVDPLGNEVMLDFGHALYCQHATFTFPKAEKLKGNSKDAEETIVARAQNKRSIKKIDTD
ncbi:MAG: hypothetical protein JW804_09530 [Sedimentisphaerales bacterium]|nr:hypothetical protein [Sedimentisphaerales bacterium]